MKHGYGIWKDSSGDIYKGNFTKNKKAGYGEYYYFSNRKVFRGEFENGFPVERKKNSDKKLPPLKSCKNIELDLSKPKFRSKMIKSSEKALSKNGLSNQRKLVGSNIEVIRFQRNSKRMNLD